MYRSAAEQQALREIATDFTILIVLEVVLLGVIALILWPLGEVELALSLAKGFGVFYLTVWAVFWLSFLLLRAFRIDDDPPTYDAYLLINLTAGAIPLVGWAAFAALTVRAAAADAPLWLAAVQWFIGLFTCWMAYGVVSTYWSGSFYKGIHLPLATVAFVFFAAWPAAARFLFGWYFHIWG